MTQEGSDIQIPRDERMVGSDWETMMTLWRTLIKNFFALNLLHF